MEGAGIGGSLWEKENDLGRGEGLSKKKVIPNIWPYGYAVGFLCSL